ncbi:MAG: DUF2914 domain-containing protein [Persephonella sp.]|nr:MAG: DUF2914 domain-containing protein [Persephonella sp.]
MKKIVQFALTSLIFSQIVLAGTEVNKIVCGENVENREVINPSDEFPNSLDRIYCLSSIKTDEAPTTVYHVWYYNGKEIAKVELPVNANSPSYRVWSSKKIIPSFTGDWKLVVEDKDGNVLGKKEFKVVKAEVNTEEEQSENNKSENQEKEE